MSRETSKWRTLRGKDYVDTHFSGRVIDIGCGPDLVVPHAEPFDLSHGNAEEIGRLRPQGAYDVVFSSHCLEHMRDVKGALAQWWSLVRDSGYLILIVPDEDLYEQGGWPSLFNSDHKATFRLRKKTTWSPVSYDIEELVKELPGAEILECMRQDYEYDYALQKTSINGWNRALFYFAASTTSLLRRLQLSNHALARVLMSLLVKLGAPVDQTAGDALAQLQVVARKCASQG